MPAALCLSALWDEPEQLLSEVQVGLADVPGHQLTSHFAF